MIPTLKALRLPPDVLDAAARVDTIATRRAPLTGDFTIGLVIAGTRRLRTVSGHDLAACEDILTLVRDVVADMLRTWPS